MTVANVASLGARLANLELVPDGTTSLGVETTRGVIVVRRRLLACPPRRIWTTCYNMARAGEVRAVLDAVGARLRDSRSGEGVLLDPAEVRFAPLVTRPQKIVCVGSTTASTPKRPPHRSRLSRPCSTSTTTP